MAQYALLLNCSTGTAVGENEGVFDSVTWVSPSGNACVDPNTQALAMNAGDAVTFAIQVTDANGNSQPAWLNWICVIVTAVTAPGNRRSRNADNNTPFRLGGKPNTVLLANNTQAGGTSAFTTYGANGLPASGPYQGFAYMPVVKDVPPGASAPARSLSQYEAVVVASLTDSSGQLWQFGFDPEMDVNNNN